MAFSLWDVMKASFIKLIGSTRHVNMLHRGIKKLRYDFDIVRVIRMVKNANVAMNAFLSDTNKLYLRHTANNIVNTSSEDDRILQDWNPEENYLDLSPDEEKDKDNIKSLIQNKWNNYSDFNSPLVAERIVQNCFIIGSKEREKAQFAEIESRKLMKEAVDAKLDELASAKFGSASFFAPEFPEIKPQEVTYSKFRKPVSNNLNDSVSKLQQEDLVDIDIDLRPVLPDPAINDLEKSVSYKMVKYGVEKPSKIIEEVQVIQEVQVISGD